MSKIINFKSRTKAEFEVQPKPYPASKNIPKWFTEAEPYEGGKMKMANGHINAGFKKCVPMLDAMLQGYIIPLWADVFVNYENSAPSINWKTKASVFQFHGNKHDTITPPTGYHNLVFKYTNCWIPQTPKGYSCLIISPLGHRDLPFYAVPAVVDTDSSTLELVFPMWIKKDFNGVVQKGTPLIQVIPFKRDDWESTFDYYEDGEYHKIIEEKNFNSTIVGHYLKNHWSKKSFK
jgi:hypothetical protein